MASPDLEPIRALQQQLNQHPIYAEIKDQRDLQTFMQHHVFSVWDFMSLIKYLQQVVAPTNTPWMPHGLPYGNPAIRYFINQLVLEEESDCIETDSGPHYSSHFEFYCKAMDEIGADGALPGRFLEKVREQSLDQALYSDLVPLPSRHFVETTFGFIREDKPHNVAAALAVGRERVIPDMFRRLIDEMQLSPDQAPAFHTYLRRHIHLDQDFHGPLSLQLLDTLCGDDPIRLAEAATAAEEAVCARIRFWDGVLEAIQANRIGH
ncbi:MAG TPA: DUF3050 domain-containing protein [Chromatiaceae bacterium]|jgi:hypothetical protein|nr:MAG: hypothetical protein N838_11600 [Thiohalocapsa sp. PB-PSB1]QQO53279.1 MAG: DUF3050 domain-containing protein [Thiohalocapsa sp. PB-PSB1]HBG94176.1 DUF3050 domain-containing protein [Chromatiaceae bacterium]HCS91454.1 DUF3050 domain-containing protein [Chromatiaceae bacterium]